MMSFQQLISTILFLVSVVTWSSAFQIGPSAVSKAGFQQQQTTQLTAPRSFFVATTHSSTSTALAAAKKNDNQ